MARDEKFSGTPQRSNRPPDRRRQPGQSLSEEIMELDSELLRLLVRRTVLMDKLRKGRAHASTPGIIKSEKQIRGAWEQQSGRLGGSLRLSRQLFGLINDLGIQPEREGESHAPFNLSPSRQPVDVNVPGPVSTVITQLWLTLAAAGGRPTRLRGAPRSAPLLDTVRAFEQTGVSMEWKDDSLVLDGGEAPDYHGKAIFLGDDLLTFYLFAFLGVSKTGKLRFTGGPSLKEADFSVLSRFLPLLGARLVSVVPGTKGMPVNLECSGVLPDEITLPADLPIEAVLGLMTAALNWRSKVSFDLSELTPGLQKFMLDLAKRAFPIVSGLGQVLENSINYNGYAISDLDFPAEIQPPIDPVLAASMLALPIFTGGSVKLSGRWTNIFQVDEIIDILKLFGLEVKADSLGVSSVLAPGSVWPDVLELSDLSPYFHPLFWVLNARLAVRAHGPVLIRRWPAEADLELAEEFMAQLGYKLDRVPEGLMLNAMDQAEYKTVAAKSYGWPCPNFCWGLAMSLGAFMRSNLKISNPDCVSAQQPDYWFFYNRLPSPKMRSVKPDAEVESAPQPGRRRIRTDVISEPEPREGFEEGN